MSVLALGAADVTTSFSIFSSPITIFFNTVALRRTEKCIGIFGNATMNEENCNTNNNALHCLLIHLLLNLLMLKLHLVFYYKNLLYIFLFLLPSLLND